MTKESEITTQQLLSLMQTAASVNSTADLDTIVTDAVDAACKITGSETGSLLLSSLDRTHLAFSVALGKQADSLKEIRIPADQGIAGYAFKNGAPTIVNDVQSDNRFYRVVDDTTNFVTKSMIAVPLKVKGEPIGVLQVINKREGGFNQFDMLLVNAFCNLVAPAIQTALNYSSLHRSYLDISRQNSGD